MTFQNASNFVKEALNRAYLSILLVIILEAGFAIFSPRDVTDMFSFVFIIFLILSFIIFGIGILVWVVGTFVLKKEKIKQYALKFISYSISGIFFGIAISLVTIIISLILFGEVRF